MRSLRQRVPKWLSTTARALSVVAVWSGFAWFWFQVIRRTFADEGPELWEVYGAFGFTLIVGSLVLRRMVPLLQRYVLDEMLKTFALAVVAITVIASVGLVLTKVLEQGVGPWAAITLMGLSMPLGLYFGLPLAAVLATTLTYGRLTAENEILAARSSGVPVLGLMWPAVLLALLATVGTLGLAAWPLSESRFEARSLIIQNPEHYFKAQLKNKHKFDFDQAGAQLFVEGIDGDILHAPAVIWRRPGGQWYIYAFRARVRFTGASAVHMIFWDAVMFSEAGGPPNRGTFSETWRFDIELRREIGELPLWALMRAQHYPEQYSPELDEGASEARRQREKQKVRAEAMAELHGRLAQSLGCFGMVLLGAGLGMLLHSAHLLIAFGVAFAPWLASTLLTKTCVDTVENAIETPEDIAWLIWLPSGGLVLVGLAVLWYLVAVWARPRKFLWWRRRKG